MTIRTLAIGAVVVAAAIGITAQRAAGQASDKAKTGAAPDKAAIEKALVANETKINEAVVKGDIAAFNALVATDGWSLEATGPMPTSEFSKMISQVKIEPGWKISDTKVVALDARMAILTYKWTGKGTFMGQPVPSPTWCSTTYANRGGKWLAVFHQETPAVAPPK